MSTQEALTEAIKYGYRELRPIVDEQITNYGRVDAATAARALAILDMMAILTGRTHTQILDSVLKRVQRDQRKVMA